ncbi:MAG: RIP metalloprotease RseP, partial [Burkholderiaceae bacterium]|nr:RIP metalloprotease RseP [Burkholderiaceae bacterium]
LLRGDLITGVDGAPVADGVAFIELVRASPGKTLRVALRRGARDLELAVTPEAEKSGAGANAATVGKIKAEVALAPEMVTIASSPPAALAKGVAKVWDSSVLTLKMMGRMIVGEASWKNLTGPITIADYAGQTARVGVVSYLTFVAFISLSLGVMNLLPIPVLDGGHLLYYSLEVLTGRKLSERTGELLQRFGVGLLVTLMVVAVFNDVMRLLS